MPLSLAGTLKDPYGKPLPSAVIRFDAVTTSSSVLNHISAEATTDATGAYAIQVEFGQYNIRVQSGRSFYDLARGVQITSSTTAATLNELIVDWQAESAVTPQIIVEMREIADETRGYRDEADASATAAATSEANADQSEAAALASQQAAATSETNAANSATAAATSESNAAASEGAALASEQAADQSETLAEQWATSQSLVDGVNYGAKKYALDASVSQAAAAQSETNAATSETNAAGSASAALTSEQNADASEAGALASQQAAATSEANAATSEANAASSASAAATSETNAQSSETAAAGSASAAATSEANAAASETSAGDSASAAATSEANAAGSATSAQATLDTIQSAYYGPLASDPATDPNGNPPSVGDRYYNTTAGGERVFDGTWWVANDIFSHEQATDPHPQYLTATEGDVAYDAAGTAASAVAAHEADANPHDQYEQKSALASAAYRAVGAGSDQLPDVATLSTLSPMAWTKADRMAVAWNTTGAAITTNQEIVVGIGGTLQTIAAGSAVTLPALSSGTDYTIHALADGTLQAVDADSAAPANSRVVGGFHQSLSGSIIPGSLWDLAWRPKSASPRGMVLSPDGRIWVDIYLMDVDYGLNGYSRAGVTIADGGSPPKIPALYGGNGTAAYDTLTWYEAGDMVASAGKRLPFYEEFSVFAYGVVERQAVGTDPGTTQHQAGHRSACGVEQATGVMWQWGADINGSGSGWQDIADGRGDVYATTISAVLLGAGWDIASHAGSRASYWNNEPSYSGSSIGARGVCDHLIL